MLGRAKAAAGAALLTACVILYPQPASAATVQQICGSGYSIVNQAAAGSYVTVYLLYNSASGMNCVVAYKGSATSGTSHPMDAWLEVKRTGGSKGAFDSDPGSYSSYAGPVRLSGAGRCVMWGGRVTTGSTFRGAEGKTWQHCG